MKHIWINNPEFFYCKLEFQPCNFHSAFSQHFLLPFPCLIQGFSSVHSAFYQPCLLPFPCLILLLSVICFRNMLILDYSSVHSAFYQHFLLPFPCLLRPFFQIKKYADSRFFQRIFSLFQAVSAPVSVPFKSLFPKHKVC